MKLAIISSIRTNNFNDERIMQKITEMWKEASHHLSKHEGVTYGVYHNYESDYKGDYSLSIGIEDNNGPSIIEIPEKENYEIFKVNTTEEHGISNAWSKIWHQEENGTIERVYSFDFEKYYPNGEIEIYIAIK
ncbi:GyrI-like domain-containing protein [Amphibacillus cookii]|uniref:GyrI-like domain-containing protein n=1 Tax=Amphibacillus cookii TaxID=767787 RepID=UPI00195E2FFD|nr:effector binding domain-containing protein [Amphibacillus cookii]MBM7542787.1 putative transcriptional regulator YdeE [Amphibacillus cookii]